MKNIDIPLRDDEGVYADKFRSDLLESFLQSKLRKGISLSQIEKYYKFNP